MYKKVPIMKSEVPILSEALKSKQYKLINIYREINEANTFE